MFTAKKTPFSRAPKTPRHAFLKPRPTRFNGPAKTCNIQEKCQACDFVNEPYEKGLLAKEKQDTQILINETKINSRQILKAVASPKTLAYRSVAKLAVRPGFDGFSIGLFEPESHRIVDLTSCPLHLPSISELIPFLKECFAEQGLTAFNEKTKAGDIKYVVIRADHRFKKTMLTFVAKNKEIKAKLLEVSLKLRRMFSYITAVYMNVHDTDANFIFGEETIHLIGQKHLLMHLNELKFQVGPLSFFQTNPYIAELIYRRIEQMVGTPKAQNAVAWDLYAGVGTISLTLARLGFQILSVEENPMASQDGLANRDINNIPMNKICFSQQKVEDLLIPSWADEPEVICVNPARQGIGESLIREKLAPLSKNKGLKLIYVSCNLQSLVRDLKVLEESGFYVRQAEPFDMFPHTNKLEWLVMLTTN